MDNRPVDERALLAWVQQRARIGINQARKARKYAPKGPLSPVESVALQALIAIERRVKLFENER